MGVTRRDGGGNTSIGKIVRRDGSSNVTIGKIVRRSGGVNTTVYQAGAVSNQVTVSGTITDSITNATISTPLSYSVTGTIGQPISFTRTVTAANGYSHGNYSENSSFWSVSRSGNTLTFTATAPSSNMSNVDFTMSGAASLTNYSVTGSVTATLSNCTINVDGDTIAPYIVNETRTINSGGTFNVVLTPNNNASFSNASNATVTNLNEFTEDSKTLNSDGTITIVLSYTAGASTINDPFTVTATAASTLRTVTLDATNNISGAGLAIGMTEVTGAIGSTHDVNVQVTTSTDSTYFSTLPSIANNDNFTIKSTTDSMPIYSADTNNFIRRRTFVITVTIPSNSVTDEFDVNGATATVKQVSWDSPTLTLPAGTGPATWSHTFRALDIDDSTLGVEENVAWLTGTSISAYSGGVGTVSGTIGQNASFSDDRSTTVTLSSDIGDATDDLTLTQVHQEPAAAATTGSFSADSYTFSYEPSSSDKITLQVTTNGAWQITNKGLPSGWTIESTGTQNASGSVTITKPSGNTNITGNIEVSLFPSDSTDTDDRLDVTTVAYEPAI